MNNPIKIGLWLLAIIFGTGVVTWFVRYKLIPGIRLWFLIFRLRPWLKKEAKKYPEDQNLKKALDLSGKLLRSRPWLIDDDDDNEG